MTALKRPSVSPTGLTIWPLATGALSIVWLGPGSGLFLGFDPTSAEGSMVRIEHRTADGEYATRKEAAKAARAFAAEVPD